MAPRCPALDGLETARLQLLAPDRPDSPLRSVRGICRRLLTREHDLPTRNSLLRLLRDEVLRLQRAVTPLAQD